MESGTTTVTYAALSALLELYDAGPDDTARLEALAKRSRRRVWSDAYRQDVDPQSFLFLGYEDSASRVNGCHSLVVPTLLQSEEYARSLVETLHRDIAKQERVLKLGKDRRQSWLSALNRRRVDILLDESVLRRRIGDDRTMRDQVARIKDFAYHDNVAIRVIPLGVEGYLGMSMSFHILDFADSDDAPVAFVEDPVTDAVLDITLYDDPGDVDAYISRYAEVEKFALSTAETALLLDELAGADG